MEKLLNYIKSKYKILIPIMVVFVLLITVYFFYREYKYDNYRNKKEVEVYQHFNSVLVDYTAQVVYNLRDVIVDIKPIKSNVEYELTPIYYKKDDKVVFPQEMSIIFPLKETSQYKLYKYASYVYDKDMHKIDNNNNKLNSYNAFFLYNGVLDDMLYFFPDEVSLNVDSKEIAKLSKMSFVRLIGGYTLEYYDKENDKADFIEIDGKRVTVSNSYMDVNLTDRYLNDFGKKVLLFKPDSLKGLSN